MTTTKIEANKLGEALMKTGEAHRSACFKAAIAAARKFKVLLVSRTDDMEITDRGVLKNSWKAEKTEYGAIVFSDCPYAGIIELGARPHPVSREGQIAIAEWAMRKLGLDEKEARSASFLICRKIAIHGQKPKYLVRGVLDKATEYYHEELTRIVRGMA